MKEFIKFSILIFFVISFTELKAQTDFRPGYVITNDGQRLDGLIDYRGDSRNAKQCDFKAGPNAEVKHYLPTEINGYRYNNSKFFVSKKVKGQTLFLEFLVDGIADLYFNREEDNSGHFFIEKSDGKIFELTNAEELVQRDGKNYVHEDKEYIGLLKIAFADCPQLYPLINQTPLEAKSLVTITKKYHNYVCDTEKCIVYEKDMTTKVSFAPFVSMNASFLNFGNTDVIYQKVKFGMADYPGLGVLMNTLLARTNEKISIQASAEVSKSDFSGDASYNNYVQRVHFQPIIIKGKAGVKYTLPAGKFKYSLVVGGHLINLQNKEGKRTQDAKYETNVFTTYYTDDILAKFNYGYNVDLAMDFQISSSLKSFVGIGYTGSTGSNKNYDVDLLKGNWNIPLTTSLKTFNINTGIYF